jgi:lipopolysaccharide transport system permease protein
MRGYLNLVKELAWSDFRLRYIKTRIGLLWAVLNPFLLFAVLYFVVSIFAGLKTPEYFFILLVGIVLWNYFADATMSSMNNLIDKRELIRKTHFSITVIPFSSCLQTFMILAINLVILLVFLALGGISFTWHCLVLPVIAANFLMTTLGISYIVSALNVPYQDIRYVWTFMLQLGFWVTPVIYPVTMVPEKYMFLYTLNPVARIIHESRSVLIFHSLPLRSVFITFLMSSAVLFIGYRVFRVMTQRIIEGI